MKNKSRYRLANISLNLKAYYRQISERLRHKERKVSEGYIEEIVKFPPIKKEKALTKKRTDVKDAHDRYFQNKPGGSYQIPGFDIIIKRVSSQPIKNTDNNPLIDQINNLEEKYLEIVSQNWLKNKTLLNGDDKLALRIYFGIYLENEMGELRQKFQKEFYRIEGHIGRELKTKGEILKVYIDYLAIEIKELHIRINVE